MVGIQAGSTSTSLATWISTGWKDLTKWTNRKLPETDRFPVDEQYCQVKFESFGFTNKQVINWAGFDRNYYQQIISHIFVLQIQLAWMEESQNNVNQNISLAQFGFK